MDGELGGRVGCEVGGELSILLHVIGEAEGDARCLVQWRLDDNDVVHFGLQRLKDSIELPAATATLVDDEFDLRLERSERLESQVEEDRLVW